MLKRVSLIAIPAVVVVALFVGVTPASADFVCPVLPVSDNAVDNVSPNATFITISGGDTSILPGKAGNPDESPVDVPDHATNDNGTGSPGGSHARPGDSNYGAIWNTD